MRLFIINEIIYLKVIKLIINFYQLIELNAYYYYDNNHYYGFIAKYWIIASNIYNNHEFSNFR